MHSVEYGYLEEEIAWHTYFPSGRELFTPFEAKVESDGMPVGSERLTGLAAGAVRDIGLGFRPFFGAGRKPGLGTHLPEVG